MFPHASLITSSTVPWLIHFSFVECPGGMVYHSAARLLGCVLKRFQVAGSNGDGNRADSACKGRLSGGFLRIGPAAFCAALILALCVACAVPYDWPGVYDAATLERIGGFTARLPAASVVLEPIAGPARAFALGPALRTAGFSWIAWAAILGAAAEVIRLALRRPAAGEGGILRRAAFSAARAFLPPVLTALFLLTAMFPYIPGYRLSADDPDVMLADFHTHTWHSDGYFPPSYVLRWHRMHGFDAVAIADPHTHDGAAEAEKALANLPGMTVITAEERRYPGAGYFLVLGLPEILDTDPLPRIERVAEYAHGRSRAAVISCPCIRHEDRLPASRLMGFGFDAIEAYNHGWQPSTGQRAEILAAREAFQRPMVASLDWHGKGMGGKCWTALRVPGWRSMPGNGERARAVIDVLAERRAGDVRAVVIGSPGPASAARIAFDPFVTLSGYFLGLGPAQLASWILWIAAFAVSARLLGCGRPVFAARLAVSSACLILSAMFAFHSVVLAAGAASAPDPAMLIKTAAHFACPAAASAALAFALRPRPYPRSAGRRGSHLDY